MRVPRIGQRNSVGRSGAGARVATTARMADQARAPRRACTCAMWPDGITLALLAHSVDPSCAVRWLAMRIGMTTHGDSDVRVGAVRRRGRVITGACQANRHRAPGAVCRLAMRIGMTTHGDSAIRSSLERCLPSGLPKIGHGKSDDPSTEIGRPAAVRQAPSRASSEGSNPAEPRVDRRERPTDVARNAIEGSRCGIPQQGHRSVWDARLERTRCRAAGASQVRSRTAETVSAKTVSANRSTTQATNAHSNSGTHGPSAKS
jgi:hypothetical protein